MAVRQRDYFGQIVRDGQEVVLSNERVTLTGTAHFGRLPFVGCFLVLTEEGTYRVDARSGLARADFGSGAAPEFFTVGVSAAHVEYQLALRALASANLGMADFAGLSVAEVGEYLAEVQEKVAGVATRSEVFVSGDVAA